MDKTIAQLRALIPEALILGVLVVTMLSARSSLADHYVVPTGSMIPTVEIGDRVLVDKRAYGLRLPFSDIELRDAGAPERGDVVVLSSPENGITLLKRVVAVPGDRVSVRRGRLILNGMAVKVEGPPTLAVEHLGSVTHELRLTAGGGPDYGPKTLGPHKFLVMGDNRGNSHDGRSFGLVEERTILGRVEGIYWRGGRPRWVDLRED